jgi:hypothetical protein
MSEAPAPRFARPFVAAFFAAIVVCGILTIEAWPLTGWQLFSHVRTDEQSAWSATAVDGRGREVEYSLGNSEQGYRGFNFLMNGFAERSPAEQQELCDTWRGGTEALLGFEAREVRIYLSEWRLSERDGDRAVRGEPQLRYVCRAGAVDGRA